VVEWPAGSGRDIPPGPTLVPARPLGADRLHGKAMRQYDVVTGRFQFGRRQFRPAPFNVPSHSRIQESSGFVEREMFLTDRSSRSAT